MRASHISREGFLSGLLIGTLSRVVSGAIAGASLARHSLASDARTGAEQIPPFSEAPNLPDGAALEGA